MRSRSLCILLFCIAMSLPKMVIGQSREVVFLPERIAAPEGAKKLGSISVGNNATATSCDYEAIVAEAKEKAAAMGGNVVKVTSLAAPTFISKCYKVKADVYSATQLPECKKSEPAVTAPQAAANNAVIRFYRLKDTLALMPSYDVHLNNDSVVYRARSRSQEQIVLAAPCSITLWAHTERRAELKLTLEPGKQYYVRCGLVKGEIRMLPVLESVDEQTGAKEFKKDEHRGTSDVHFLKQVH
jgi:hypothetical protein